MQQCANCGHQNRAGIVFCENCGASLIGKVPLDTKSLDSSTEGEKSQLGIDANVLNEIKAQGISTFDESTSLRLDIQGSTDPILFKPKTETIFGRRDPATGAMPDVDLTPFAGYRMGVSRRHAAIRSSDNQNLDLWDLGSSNGTFLNEERLNPHRPYRLRDGDEIRLGSMGIRIYFQRDDKSVSKTETSDQTVTPPQAPKSVPVTSPVTGIETRAVEPLSEAKAAEGSPVAGEPAVSSLDHKSPVVSEPAKPAEPASEAKTAEGSPAASEPAKPIEPASEAKPAEGSAAAGEPAKPTGTPPSSSDKTPLVDPPKTNDQPDPSTDKPQL